MEPRQGVQSAGTREKQGGGNGRYLVNFSPAFKDTPTIVATQVYPNDLSSGGGDTRDNAVIVGIDNNETKIKTGSSGGSGSNPMFCFTAHGDQ